MNQSNDNIIAVDISKDTLEVRTHKRHFQVSNDLKGFKALLKRSDLSNPFVVFEATGG